mmetsp:Transcript_41188/g.94736  ORF Transcript_41188/g.94736 Transcript_41188/m.94736 type:complete len:230 (-) Transcript_41188:96-785(-)
MRDPLMFTVPMSDHTAVEEPEWSLVDNNETHAVSIGSSSDTEEWIVEDDLEGRGEVVVVEDCENWHVESAILASRRWQSRMAASLNTEIVWQGSSALQKVGAHASTNEWAAALHTVPFVTGAVLMPSIAIYNSKIASKVPVLANVILRNTGSLPWPASTRLCLVAGVSHGFEQLWLGPIPAGETIQVSMDLHMSVAGMETTPGVRSAWVLTDDSGEPFGPLLILEALFL